MRSDMNLYSPAVTPITLGASAAQLKWANLMHQRLEGIFSGYWTPLETRSQGYVSLGSSTLLPSAVLRPTEERKEFVETTFAPATKPPSLTLGTNGDTLSLVSQAACQPLARTQDEKDPGPTTRGLSYFGHAKWPTPPRVPQFTSAKFFSSSRWNRSTLRLRHTIQPSRKLRLSAQDSV